MAAGQIDAAVSISVNYIFGNQLGNDHKSVRHRSLSAFFKNSTASSNKKKR